MYRNYINTSLDLEKLKEINRNSAANTKYCNFICKDFRDSKIFDKQRSYCNDCRNYLNLAEKQIAEKKITIEQFKQNPGIVYGIEITLDTKREYDKFHKGAAFYIVSFSDENDEYKIGFDGEDINERFRGYRTFSPKLKVHYVVYTNKAKLVEEIMLTRLDSKKLEKNHEVLVNVDLEQLITDVETKLLFLNIQKTILSSEELDKYNQC